MNRPLDDIFAPGMPCLVTTDEGVPYAAVVEEITRPDDGKPLDANLISLRVYSLQDTALALLDVEPLPSPRP